MKKQEKLDEKVVELTNDLQRTRADFENYRKQMDAQKQQAMDFAKQETVRKILPLIDDMGRAIAANPEALEPVKKTLEKAMAELKLTQIDSAEGVDFNPDLHEAVTMEEGEGTREVIAETLRAGYMYEGAVLRPAMVKVKTIA